MSYSENKRQSTTQKDRLDIPKSKEIIVPEQRLLRHVLCYKEKPRGPAKILQVPATDSPPLIQSDFYLANIGSYEEPTLLELRFEPIPSEVKKLDENAEPTDPRIHISLLMTNERHPILDLRPMGSLLNKAVGERGIEYEVIIAPESLGSKLSQSMAEAAWREEGRLIYITSLQKGKPAEAEGNFFIGSPKPWIEESAGIAVASGTSNTATQQRLYLDQKIARAINENHWRALLVDDARLTQGTINSSVELLQSMDINIAGIATVLNEGDPADNLHGIPFVFLTKLPLNMKVAEGYKPIPGTYDGLDYFYLEVD